MPAGRGKRFSLLSLQPRNGTAPPKALSVCLHPFFHLMSEMDVANQPDSRQGHQYLNSGPVPPIHFPSILESIISLCLRFPTCETGLKTAKRG